MYFLKFPFTSLILYYLKVQFLKIYLEVHCSALVFQGQGQHGAFWDCLYFYSGT